MGGKLHRRRPGPSSPRSHDARVDEVGLPLVRMRQLRKVEDTHVSLAFYGSIVYLAVVSSLGSQDEPPGAGEGTSALIGTAVALYVAHVFASLVPSAARSGRLRGRNVAASLRHATPLMISVIVPVVPLVLADVDVMRIDTAYRISVRITLVMLFGIAVVLSLQDGLSWRHAITAAGAIILVSLAVIWLESRAH